MPITYPHPDNLSTSGQPIHMGPGVFLARSPSRRSRGFCTTRRRSAACHRRVGAPCGAIPPNQPRASHDARGAGAQNADHLAEKCWKCTDIGEVVCTLGAAAPGMACCPCVNPLFRALTCAFDWSTRSTAECWGSCLRPAQPLISLTCCAGASTAGECWSFLADRRPHRWTPSGKRTAAAGGSHTR